MAKLFIHFLCITLLATTYVSCDKDIPGDPEPPFVPENLSIESMREFLPIAEIEGKTKAVFENATGDQRILKIRTEDYIVTKIIGDQMYEAERYVIDYQDTTTTEYSLWTSASGNYIDEEIPPNLFIISGLRQFVEEAVALVTVIEGGLPNPYFSQFHEEYTIANISFEDVFSNIPFEEHPEYGRIFYTTKMGIVGFADREGDLFALKELRE